MRISSNTVVDQGLYALQLQQNSLLQTQQQVATGRQMVTPADNPVAAGRALEVQQMDSVNTQYTANRTQATNTMSLSESILGSVSTTLTDVQTLMLQAGSGSLNASDRQNIATSLNGDLQQLLGLANSGDGAGNYLFAGAKGTTQPFVNTPTGIQYQGDSGGVFTQISSGRQLQTTIPGSDIFQNIKSGNSVFTTAASPTNLGTGVIDAGLVTDQAKWNSPLNSKNLSINFSTAGGSTTYDIVDNTPVPPVSLLTGVAAAAGPYPKSFVSGTPITLSGLAAPYTDFGVQTTITGSPANGDTFSLKPSANQSVFSTIQNIITALQAPSGTAGASTNALQNSLAAANQNLSNALGNILNIRAGNGARLNEISLAQSTGNALGVQYKQTLSSLQDVDMTAALAKIQQQQTSYQAALKSFQAVQGLSLFNYM